MLKVEMTAEMLDRNINSLMAAVSLVEQKIATTHSGIDKFMLESFILETNELIAVLAEQKYSEPKSVVFNLVPQPEA